MNLKRSSEEYVKGNTSDYLYGNSKLEISKAYKYRLLSLNVLWLKY